MDEALTARFVQFLRVYYGVYDNSDTRERPAWSSITSTRSRCFTSFEILSHDLPLEFPDTVFHEPYG